MARAGSGYGNSTSKVRMEAHSRRWIALALRIKGLDYNEIWEEMKKLGDEFTYAQPQSIRHLIVKAVAALDVENVEDVRTLELARLDAMQKALWHQAAGGTGPDGEYHKGGHQGAINTVLKIMNHRAKLLGLEMPKKIAQTDTKGRDIKPLSSKDAVGRIWEIIQEAEAQKDKNVEDGQFVEIPAATGAAE